MRAIKVVILLSRYGVVGCLMGCVMGCVIGCVPSAFAQSIMETSAAAAGGSVGGVAGKQVSDGLTAIFGKLDKSTSKAAKASKRYSGPSEPLLEAGPGVPNAGPESVPPPPPLRRRAPAHAVAIAPPPPPPVAPAISAPPPPRMTADELRAVAPGMERSALLKLGAPASRVTMFDDGHVVELYLYSGEQSTLGEVRLSDGQVSKVQLR